MYSAPSAPSAAMAAVTITLNSDQSAGQLSIGGRKGGVGVTDWGCGGREQGRSGCKNNSDKPAK